MALLSGFGDVALLFCVRNAFLAHLNALYRIFYTQPKKRYPWNIRRVLRVFMSISEF